MTKVLGYCRTSTEGQEYGIEKQENEISDYCDEKGYELIGIHTNKVSGRKSIISLGFENQKNSDLDWLPYIDLDDRNELYKVFHSVRDSNHNIDKVIVFNPSRLARKSHYQGMLEEVFDEAGAGIEYVESSDKWFVRKILSLIDEYEVRQTIKRTTKALATRKENGKWNGRTPVGYDTNDDGKLVRTKRWYTLNKAEDLYNRNSDWGYSTCCDEANRLMKESDTVDFDEEKHKVKPHQVRAFVNRDGQKISRFLAED